MSRIGPASAALASLIVESLLTGLCLVLSLVAIHVLLKRGVFNSTTTSVKRFNRILFVVTILLACAIFVHWILDISKNFDAFIYHDGGMQPAAILGRLSSPENVFKTTVHVCETAVGDCILIYRLYVIWDRQKHIIAFPSFITMGMICCGLGLTVRFGLAVEGQDLFSNPLRPWMISYFTTLLVTNIYATTLIVYRIVRTEWRMKPFHMNHSSLRTVRIVTESGLLYTALTFTNLILYLCASNAQSIVMDSTSPMVGIVFYLIIIRVELGTHREGSSGVFSFVDKLSKPPNRDTLGWRNTIIQQDSGSDVRITPYNGAESPFQVHPMMITITRDVEVHRVSDYSIKTDELTDGETTKATASVYSD